MSAQFNDTFSTFTHQFAAAAVLPDDDGGDPLPDRLEVLRGYRNRRVDRAHGKIGDVAS